MAKVKTATKIVSKLVIAAYSSTGGVRAISPKPLPLSQLLIRRSKDHSIP